eukprot:TRINITY_DN299_c0_g3_i1.p1 TRINITY_DN299_c0_g3~~TRINITY_DN299_c0_g3_i1.p1  ORF type:complete len:357 (+),score=125.81 TRINITY_DN299_c0_g3_i1:156-1226(+)
MGNMCVKHTEEEKDAQQVTRNIDALIRKEKNKLCKETKILLLGAGESGKSTIVKQMRIIFVNGFSEEERITNVPVIFHNMLTSMKILITNATVMEIPLSSSNKANAQAIMNIPTSIEALKITPEMGIMFDLLWKDPGIRECFGRSNEFQLNDSTAYFFDNIERITVPNFVPNDMDLLRVRAKTTGVAEIDFKFHNITVRMVDVGGQRSERKKWIHCFESVTMVLFCSALSEYDLFLEENNEVNRMHESLQLFEETINGQWFANTPIILFLNKKDIFADKIKKIDMKMCFPNYRGGDEYESAVGYVTKKFKEKNKNTNREIYIHITCATDTQNIRFVWSALKDVLISSSLDEAGFVA